MPVKTYKSQPIEVQALKWDGKQVDAAAALVKSWESMRVDMGGTIRFSFGDHEVRAGSGEKVWPPEDLVVKAGDYFVKHSESSPVGWVPAAVFESSFTEVEE